MYMTTWMASISGYNNGETTSRVTQHYNKHFWAMAAPETIQRQRPTGILTLTRHCHRGHPHSLVTTHSMNQNGFLIAAEISPIKTRRASTLTVPFSNISPSHRAAQLSGEW